jgi:hypothetical protein
MQRLGDHLREKLLEKDRVRLQKEARMESAREEQGALKEDLDKRIERINNAASMEGSRSSWRDVTSGVDGGYCNRRRGHTVYTSTGGFPTQSNHDAMKTHTDVQQDSILHVRIRGL